MQVFCGSWQPMTFPARGLCGNGTMPSVCVTDKRGERGRRQESAKAKFDHDHVGDLSALRRSVQAAEMLASLWIEKYQSDAFFI
jgi:hypothetical protein